MTLNERLAMLDKKITNDKAKQLSAEEKERFAVQEATNKIKELSHEIWELIELANACRAKGIKLPGETAFYAELNKKALEKYGYNYGVWADGIYHGIGFMGKCSKETIQYVGYYNGGICGPWDFYTDGVVVFCKHEDEKNCMKEPNSAECKKFLTMFPQFRDAFYKWFDTEIGGTSNGN